MLDITAQAAQGLIDLAWLTLLHATWLGLAIGSIAAIASWLVPPDRHRARHVMLLAALATIVVGSLFAAIVQRFRPRHEVTSVTVGSSIVSTGAVSPMASDAVAARPTPPRVASGRATSGVRRLLEATKSVIEGSRPIATAAWLLGVSSFGMTLLVGTLSLRRLRHKSIAADALQARVRVLARMLRLRRVPDVRVHRRLVEPCLTGVIRPVVLLPADWLAAAALDEVDAVLAHELSHARRLDNLANLAQRVVEAFLFFHPCVLWLSRSVRREAEHAADALAIRVTGDPTALARSLESVARLQSLRPRSFRLGLAIGGDRPSLLPRIQELLGMKPKRPLPALWPLAALPAALMGAAIASSAGRAQSPPSELAPLQATVRPLDIPSEEFLRVFRADPEKLSREDLLKRLRIDDWSRKTGALEATSRENLLKLAEAQLFTFQIRIIQVDDPSWDRIRSRLTPVDGKAWLLTGDFAAIEKELQSDPVNTILRFPRITAAEGGTVTASVDRVLLPDSRKTEELHPQNLKLGSSSLTAECSIVYSDNKSGNAGTTLDSRVDLKATPVGKANRIKAKFSSCLEARTPARPGFEARTTRIEFDQEVNCDVPEGSSLIIDRGLRQHLEGCLPPSERDVRSFALITPRRVTPAEVEQSVLSRAAAPATVK